MKSKNKKRAFIAVLSVFAIGASGAALAGCNTTAGYIDAPERIEAELGTYVIPDYEVVDSNGMILAGYNVYLKSVTNADGEAVDNIVGSAVTIDDAGVYSFVYSAGSKKVKDVTVSIDFADRTAPTINYEDDLPKFFIKGNSYKMPSYTLSGDYDRSKCWAKVFHVAEDKTETEVDIVSNRFKVEANSGYYAIRIHVEDAAGNTNDYEYTRMVDGPVNVVDNKVLYLDEEFGARQVSCYQSYYTGEFVSKGTEGAHTFGDEAGAYKVSFDGKTSTKNNEGLVIMDVPAIIDINEYEEIYMYVYNDSGAEIRMGSQWWNDTVIPAGTWKRLSWNTRAWGNNVSANSVKQIGLVDITGMTIRFIFDYGQTIIPHGDFYLSAMYGTPKVESEIELGEHVDIPGGKHYINDVISLNAETIDGKTVDHYKVDGEIIPGTSFTVTKENHRIEVVYVDGELTKDNMTWASPEELAPAGNDAQTQYMGTDEYWAMSYDVYGVKSGWKYFGVYVGGTNQLLGFEIVNNTGKLSGYGGVWKWGNGIKLSNLDMSILQSASETNPVKVTYIRLGSEIRVFLDDHFVGSVEFSEFGVSGNNFGYGARKPGNNSPEPATVENFKAVAGEAKTKLYFENFAAELTIDGVKVEGKHYLGDSVTLTAGEAPEGKLFAYFSVNGNRLYDYEFKINSANTVVETVYTDAINVELAEGIRTEDGKTGTIKVAQESYIVLTYTGATPSGKYYIGFTVNGVEYIGNEVFISADTREIGVIFGDKIDTGSEKLNDISDTTKVIYALNDDGETEKWKPASVEHVTDFMFTGNDKAVDENSVIKIVTGDDGGENSFAFNSSLVDNLNEYKEIYFYVYTEKSGLKAGGWWCNDTNLVAGKWTKVSFGRGSNPGTIEGNGESKVWEDGIAKFAYRIFSAPANTTVYVTALYGVPYPDAKVEKSDDVTLSAPANGTKYKVGETVTLTAAEAPEGKVFAYFTANGEPIEGNKYVLTDNVVFDAVYNEFSTVTLADGIETVDGKTGTVRVARNMPVYLVLSDSTKYYVAFSVDGEPISGNSFTPTEGKTYNVTVETADRVENGNAQVNSVSGSAMHSGEAELDFTNNVRYNGADAKVTEDGSLKISEIGGNDVAVKSTKPVGEADLTNFKEVYFYIYTEADGIIAGTYWCNDTAAVKGQWTKITVYSDNTKNTNNNYNADGVSGKLFAAGSKGSNFIYRIMGGEGKTVYITSLYGVPYEDATVKIAEDSKDSITVSAPANGTSYKEGETVTLTAKEAPEGKAFAYFTVNSVRLEGHEYKLSAGEVTFGVVYSEISTVTLGNGVTAEDAENGKVTVGRGATVTLEFIGTVPSGKYFKGFTVDGEPVTGNTFIAENSTHTVEAVFENKEQTGNVKLTEISTVETDGLSYHPNNPDWVPEKIEYVTNVKYDGSDGAVDESGLLKVTLKGGEQAFALNKTLVNALNEYQEIYFYIYAAKDADVSGIKIGGWWCRDVDIVAGQWTRVGFTRAKAPQNVSEKSVWDENSIDKFVYSFASAKAGTVVYLTAVYGVPYSEVSVTVDDSVKAYVSVSGTFREGQIVTLTHSGAPEGQAFAYFTVNGEKYESNTYKLGKDPVVFGAEFTEISTIVTENGVATSDGETKYGRGATVTLTVDGETAPADKIFNYFTVDGERITGDKFVTSKPSHTVGAVFVENAGDLTWITSEEAEETDCEYNWSEFEFKGSAIGESEHWAIEAKAWGFTNLGSAWYSIEFLVGNNASLQIRLHSAGNASIYAMGINHSYGKDLKQLDAGVINVCKAATQENPVTFTAIRNGAEYYVLLNGSLILKTDFAFKTDDNKFGIGGTDCGTWLTAHPDYDYQYRTGEQTSECLTDVKVTCGADVTLDNADGVYKLGETVELTAAQAPAGQKFAHFVVDEVRLEGSSFTAIKTSYNVEAVYSEISTLTLGDGVVTADGETEYARGVKVILSYDPAKLGGKVVDYYIIDEGTDSEQRVLDGEFVTSSATHTVKAVLISSAEDMTWRAENASGAENVNAGECIYVKKAGNAKDWALRYTLTSLPSGGWGQLTGVYLGATSQIASLQFSGSTYTFNLYGGPVWNGSVTVPNEVADIIKNASDSSPVTLAFIKNGNYLSAYATKEGETYFIGKLDISAYVTNANATDSFGFAYRDTNFGVPVIEGDIEYVINLSKVELFAGYLNANSVNGQTSETQINNIRDAVVHSGTATLEYVNEIPEGLSDANVKETGVMKVSATNNELALNVKNVFIGNLDDYEEIYFWVYVEDDGLQAGTYWCANTDLTANQWTKVKITRDTNWAWNNGVVYNGVPTGVDEQKVYEVGSQVFVYRLMNGNGKTFYVSSLYGVPKENLAEDETTSYSVVGGDDELTGILNDNFFPDAE